MDKVLVIEDDRHIAELLRMALATQHFTPIVAGDGGTGLSEARRLLPSLILLDLMLPIMDGQEVCRRLRADEKTWCRASGPSSDAKPASHRPPALCESAHWRSMRPGMSSPSRAGPFI